MTVEMLTVHLDDGRCADMVLGLLPADERSAALAHAETCPACEARLRAHVSAAERARADVPATTVVPISASRRVATRTSRARWSVGLALAAALAVAVALPLMLQHGSRERVSFGGLPDPGVAVRTRGKASEDPRLAAGLEAYRRHDLGTAGRELEAAQVSGTSESIRRLYLAHVRYADGNARGSMELLRGVKWRDVPEPWRRSGIELLVLALRGAGESGSADSLERALRDVEPGTPFLP